MRFRRGRPPPILCIRMVVNVRRNHPIIQRRGFAFVFVVLMMIAVFGFVSLAVDFGYVQVTKTELQNVADSAARAAMTGLATSYTSAQTDGIATAGQNKVNNQLFTLASTDIDFGSYNSGTKVFTVVTGAARASATAIRINAHATVNLTFTRVIGLNTITIHATSVVSSQPQNYGIVGQNSMAMNTTVVLDRYDSSAGGYSVGSAHSLAKAASEGNITITAGTVKGDAHPGVGKTCTGGTVTGSRSALSGALNYNSVTAGSYSTTNDNASLGGAVVNGDVNFNFSGSTTFPGGVYYLRNVNLSGGCTITSTSTCTLYIYGNCTLNNVVMNAYQARPTNFRIYLLPSATLSLSNASSILADIYCPDSSVTLSNSSSLYGRIIAASINQTGSGGIHMDESLPQGLASQVILVK